MINVSFLDVGQGDSIIVEWIDNSKELIGIVDCNIYVNDNPVLNYIIKHGNKQLEFIIMSHFHSDHFSGLAAVFKYCIENEVKINKFLHTFQPIVLEAYNKTFTSQKLQSQIKEFFHYLDIAIDKCIEEYDSVTHNYNELKLLDSVGLSFLAPNGKDYHKFTKAYSKNISNVVTTKPDMNKLSTIVKINNKKKCIILTADAVKNSFKRIRNKVNEEVQLIQVPHHGSFENVDVVFWEKLTKVKNCPAVFSVGDKPKDKLPNKDTVIFFDKEGFNIHSTNFVYGLKEYFGSSTASPFNNVNKTNHLNHFSRLRSRTIPPRSITSKYQGNQTFNVLKD